MKAPLQSVPVMINDRPYCFWDVNIKDKNEDFISNYDPMYFDTIANMMHHHFEDEETTKMQRQYISFALRAYLSHAAECLFALLGATLQAPDCIYGWLFKYRTSDLNSLIDRISTGTKIHNKLSMSNVDWDSLSNTVHQISIDKEEIGIEKQERNKKIRQHYADFWHRLASEYRSADFQNIHNSMKHGYRARPGGVHLSFGLEKTPGVQAAPKDMQSLGGSDYGATYFTEDLLSENGRNIKLAAKTSNWIPKNIWYQITLIRCSLSNILSFLKIYQGHDPTTIQFVWPENLDVFEYDLKNAPGTLNVAWKYQVNKDDIRNLSSAEIIKMYENLFMGK